jgi:predicted enzyme related to lactoylglutathione lyase
MIYSYLAVALIIAFYTVLFGWEIFKTKNYGGFIAVVFFSGDDCGVAGVFVFLRADIAVYFNLHPASKT